MRNSDLTHENIGKILTLFFSPVDKPHARMSLYTKGMYSKEKLLDATNVTS
jgi:hypothetical protein